MSGKPDCTAAGNGFALKDFALKDSAFSTIVATLAARLEDAGAADICALAGADGIGCGNDDVGDCESGGNGVSKIFGCAIVPSTAICTRVPGAKA